MRVELPWIMWNRFTDVWWAVRNSGGKYYTNSTWKSEDPEKAIGWASKWNIPAVGSEGKVYDVSSGACLYGVNAKVNNLNPEFYHRMGYSVFTSTCEAAGDAAIWIHNEDGTFYLKEAYKGAGKPGEIQWVTVPGENREIFLGSKPAREGDPFGQKIVAQVFATENPVVTKTLIEYYAGTGIVGATLTISEKDGSVVCEETVDGDGNWSCTPSKIFPEGTTLYAQQNEHDGAKLVSGRVSFTPEGYKNLSPELNGEDIVAFPDEIVGEPENAHPNAKIVIKDKDSNTICETTAEADGSWSCSADPHLVPGENVYISQQIPGKGPSVAIEKTVVARDSEIPTISQLISTGGYGNGVAGAKLVIQDLDGKLLCEVTVGTDGKWMCAFDDEVMPGLPVIVTQTELGKYPASVDATIALRTNPPSDIVIEDGTASGKGENGANIVVEGPDGKVLCEAVVGPDGSWSCEYDEEKLPGGEVKVTQQKPDESVSEPIVVVVPGAVDLSKSSVVGQAGSTVANGQGTRSVTVTVVDSEDVPVPGMAVTFDYSSDLSLKTVGSSFTTDANGQVTVEFVSAKAGNYSVAALVSGKKITTPTKLPQTGQIDFIAGAVDTSVSKYTVSGQSVAVGENHTVTIWLTDAHNNAISGKTEADFSLSADTDDVDFFDFTETSDPGVYQVKLTSFVAGTKQIEAQYKVGSGDLQNISAFNNTKAIFEAGEVSVGDEGESTISGETGAVLADGKTTRQVSVLLLDQYGNPVSGETISFEASEKLLIKDSKLTTGTDGIAWIKYASTDIDTFGVRAKVGDTYVKGKVDLRFIAGNVAQDHSSFVVSTHDAVVGSDSHTVTVTVRDEQSHKIVLDESDVLEAFSLPTDGVTVSSPVLDDNGDYVFTITSTSAGWKTIAIKLNGETVDPEGNDSIHFKTDSADTSKDGKTAMSGDASAAIANGTTGRTVKAVVKDQYGNPIEGALVQFEAPSELSGSHLIGVLSDPSGQAQISYTSETAGQFEVTATVNGESIQNGSPVKLNFVADKFSTELSRYSVSKGNVVANGSDSHTVTVWLKDAKGNAVTNISASEINGKISSTATPNKGVTISSFIPAVDENDQVIAGAYVASITSISSGKKDISLFFEGTGIQENAGLRTAAFISDSPSIDGELASFIEGETGEVIADGVTTRSVVANIRDVNGNPVAGVTVAFLPEAGLNSQSDLTTVTNADGQAKVSFTTTDAKTGKFNVSASFTDGEGNEVNILKGSPVTLMFVPGAVDADTSEFTVSSDAKVADGIEAQLVTVLLKDANGNLVTTGVAEDLVAVAAPGDGVSVGGFVAGDVAGKFVAEVTSTVAGDKTITVTQLIDGTVINVPLNGNGVARFSAGGPSVGEDGKSVLTVQSGQGIADGVSTLRTSVQTYDAHGNKAGAGTEVSFNAGEGLKAKQSSTTTDENGLAWVDWSTTVKGTYEVSAVIDGQTVKGSPVDLEFVAGDFASTETNFTLSEDDVVANGNDSHVVSIQVKDGSGNDTSLADPDNQVGISVSDDNGVTVKALEDKGNGLYEAEIVSTVAGIKTVEVKVDGQSITSTNGYTIKFVPGNPDVEESGETVLAGDSSPAVANGETNLSVWAYVKDANNNPIAGAKVVFAASSGDLKNVGDLEVATNADGYAKVSFNTVVAGEYDVTATVDGNQIRNGSPVSLRFVPAGFDTKFSNYQVSTEEVVANGEDSVTITAVLKDEQGNVLGIEDGVDLSDITSKVGNSKVKVSSFEPLVEDGNTVKGSYVATATSTVAGSFSINVSYKGNGLTAKDNLSVAKFKAGAPTGGETETASYLSAQTGDGVANGKDTRWVTATIQDEYGNPVSGVSVSFLPDSSLTAVGDLSGKTDSKGTFKVEFTYVTKGGFDVNANFVDDQGRLVTIAKNAPANVSFKAGSPSTDPDSEFASSLQADAIEATADGKSQLTVDAVLVDSYGNFVDGMKVRFKVSADLQTTDLEGTTDENGVFSLDVSSNKSGVYQITADYFETTSGQWIAIEKNSPINLTFKADEPSVGNDGASTIVATGPTVEANGIATQSVVITIKDQNNNPVVGQNVEVTADSGLTLAENSEYKTDENGLLTLDYSATIAKEYKVSAKVNNTTIKGSPVTLIYHHGGFSTDGSTYQVSTGEKVADGSDAHTVTVRVADAGGNLITEAKVSDIEITVNSDANVSAVEADSANPGVFTAFVTSKVAATHQVDATYKGEKLSANGNTVARFKAGNPSVGEDGTSTISGQDGAAIANGNATRWVIVEAKDANGNPVKGQEVQFAAPAALTIDRVQPLITDENGFAKVNYSSLTAGTFAVSATVNGEAVHGTAGISFVPDQVSSRRTTFAVSEGTVAIGTGETHTVTVYSRDAQGNLTDDIDTAKLQATSSPSDVTFGSKFKKEATGTYSTTVQSNIAGEKTIAVSLNEASLSAEGNSIARFKAGEPEVVEGDSQTKLWGQTDPAVADGIATRTVSALVTDRFGNPIADQEVVFEATTGLVSIQPLKAITGTDGIAKVDFVTTTVGTFEVTAKVNGNNIVTGSPVTLTFRAGRPSVNNSVFSVSDGTRIADGKDEHVVTVTLRDHNGNLVTPADFEIADLDLEILPDSNLNVTRFEKTSTIGVYQAKVATTKAGIKNVLVTYQGAAVASSNGDEVTFVNGPVDLSSAVFTTESGSAAADGIETMNAQVNLVDSSGNPVIGKEITFSALNGNGKVFVKNGATVNTDKYGRASVDFASVLAGTFEVRAIVDGVEIGDSSNTITFTAGKIDVSYSTYSVSTGYVAADGLAAHTITVQMTDANGNLVSNVKPSNLGAVASPNENVEISDFSLLSAGVYTASVSSTVAGSKDISLTYGGKSVSADGNTVAFFQAGKIDVQKSTIVGQTGPAVADSKTTRWVKVTVVDGYNNPVSSAPVVLSAGMDLIADKMSPVLTDDNGEAMVSYSSFKSGIFPISATINGTSVAGGKIIDLQFIGAEASESTSRFSVSSGDKKADGIETQIVTALITDINGNPTNTDATKLKATITVGVEVKIGEFSATGTVGTYTAPITSTKAGSAWIEATLNGKTMVTAGNSEAVFVASQADLSVNGKSKLWGQTDPAIADGVATRSVSALVADQYGNPISGQKVSFEPSDGLVGLSTSGITGKNGVATVQFVTTTAGYYEVTASVGGQPILNGSPVELVFTAGEFSSSVSSFTVSTGDQVANGIDQHLLTVVIRDAGGNLVKLTAAQIQQLEATETTGTVMSGSFTATKTQGIYQAVVTSTTAGSFPMGVTYMQQNINTTGNKTASFIAGQTDVSKDGKSLLYTEEKVAKANGEDSIWVKAELKDSHGNPIAGKTVTFESSPAGLNGLYSQSTNKDGVAQVTYTTEKAGTYQVRAYVDGVEIANGAPASLAFDVDQPVLDDVKITVTGNKKVQQTVKANVSGADSGSTYTYQWLIDGVAVSGATGQSWKLPAAAGQRYISVTVSVSSPDYFSTSEKTSGKVGPIASTVTRLYGKDRYETSRSVASKYAVDNSVLFVATGLDYPDALSAGAAASKVGGTLVLTRPGELSSTVKDTIREKKPARIYVIGGTAAVSSRVEDQLRQASGVEVKRIGGATRYDTSQNIFSEFFNEADIAYVATGTNYADALVASRAAGYVGAPVVLVHGASQTVLPTKTANAFNKAGVSEVRVAGGQAAVNQRLVNNMSSSWRTVRIAGETRFDTAIELNKVFDSSKVDTVWIATGMDFPDALSAAGAGGESRVQPLYLSYSNCAPAKVTKAVNSQRHGERIIVGGTAALSNGVANLNNTCK